jgi:hypothetical protein
MGLNLADLGFLACQAERPPRFSRACSVFIKPDMIRARQKGHGLSDILMALCQTLPNDSAGPYLKLELANHIQDAGYLTRCEAFLAGRGFLWPGRFGFSGSKGRTEFETGHHCLYPGPASGFGPDSGRFPEHGRFSG